MWRQGEHVVILGSNGTGKTTVEETMLGMRTGAIVMLVTKIDDLRWKGWQTVRRVRDIDIRRGLRWRLFPQGTREQIAREFALMFDRVWTEGAWCVCFDEVYHLQRLSFRVGPKMIRRLEDDMSQLLTQGRAKKITVVCGVQRAVEAIREAFSEPIYVLCFQIREGEDRDKVGKRFGRTFQRVVESLARFEFAWLNQTTGEMGKANVKTLKEVFA